MAASNSGRVIPREELTEFQRWQFSTLLEEAAYKQAVSHPDETPVPAVSHAPVAVESAAAVPAYVPAPVEEIETLSLPTAEEIQAIERQAQEEGYQTGLAAGRLAAESEVNRLRAMLGGIEQACLSAEKTLADQVLDLALVVAKQFIRTEIETNRTALMPAIREAIASLPQVKEASRLMLNPEDLTALSVLLSGELPSDYWRFVPDPSLPAGSCRIQTPVSSIDLSLSDRWASLLRVLGRDQRADLAWQESDSLASQNGQAHGKSA